MNIHSGTKKPFSLLLPLLSSALLAGMLGCTGTGGGGGGSASGVDRGTPITALTEPELVALCEWSAEVIGPPFETDCGDHQTSGGGTIEKCQGDLKAIPPGCSGVTVAEFEACIETVAENPCTAFRGPACAEYIGCYLAGKL